MLAFIQNACNQLGQMVYPHFCQGCGTDVLHKSQLICAKCLHQLPSTGFANMPNNPVESIFAGRLPIQQAMAGFYFTQQSLIQHLLKQLKYRNNKAVGIFLGKQLGYQLLQTNRFNNVDLLVPLPLNPKKEQQRGYNQAAVICEGIAEIWQKPVATEAVVRKVFTESQTKQNRIERWLNMDGVFAVTNPKALENKHIALIDDVATTGATLEACGQQILQIPNTKVSIITAAYTV